MNAFGASVVRVLCAVNARRATQGERSKCESGRRRGIDVPCAERNCGWIERRGVLGQYWACRACFRD
jgi:hypothetical protein